MTRLFLELLAGFYIPVYLILMDIVVAAVFSVIVVRIKEPKVELYVVSLGGVDGQVVRAAAVKLGVCVICEAAGERLIICELLVAADGAALIGIVVAENEGEGDASVRNGLEYRLYSGIDSLCGLDFAARYLVACKYDEVGLLCVESFSMNIIMASLGMSISCVSEICIILSFPSLLKRRTPLSSTAAKRATPRL